jgi:hypothetical protein
MNVDGYHCRWSGGGDCFMILDEPLEAVPAFGLNTAISGSSCWD